MNQRQQRWFLLFSVSGVLLVADVFVVVSGVMQTADRRLWYWYANALGHQGFRAVEAISLAGVVRHSARYLIGAAVIGVLLTALILSLRGLPFSAAFLVVTVTGCGALVQAMKVAVNRNGSSLTPWTPLGHTFPSGTAALAVAIFGFLTYLTLQRTRAPMRQVLLTLWMASGIAFVVSASTYHYPTEIVGGILTGLVWLSLMHIFFWEPLRHELFVRP
ncbi:MAG TPA: phosphatase PAP2 family protein [Chloroflexota bacterium]|nr:phosphatase PAP2 family protein [Chloroflexota bacterium]